MAARRIKAFLWKYGPGLLVFSVGVGASVYVFNERVELEKAQQARLYNDTARQYQFLLQRRLDVYANSNRNLAGLFSASGSVTRDEFSDYLKASRFFERMEGARAFGYLPRVALGDVPAFEKEARALFPGYRVRNLRPGARFVFPLLYIERAEGAGPVEQLRGLDYSSIPDRHEAMQAAAWLDGPAATRVHPSATDGGRMRVVLLLAPARKAGAPSPSSHMPEASVEGYVFSALRVDNIFDTFDNGLLGQLFEVEVYEGRASPATLVYDADGDLQALSDNGQSYAAEVQFANRRWLVYFLPKGLEPATKAGADDWVVLVVGVALSLLAAQAVVSLRRYSAGRRAGADINKRFDTFFSNHPAAVYTLDPSCRFVRANGKLAQELGVSPEALVGQAAERFVAPEKRDLFRSRFLDALAGNVVAYHNVIQDVQGKRSDVSVVLMPLRTRHQITGVLGFAENITERMRAESELSESRQMLQFILDNVPQKIFWKDVNGVFLGANQKLLEDAGVASVEDIIGKTDDDFPWRGAAERFRMDDREVMRSGVPRLRIEEALYTVDGERWLETSKVPLRDAAGNVVGVLGVAEDITDRKRLEQELFRRANYDSLTGLPNRAFFYTQLEQAMLRAQRHDDGLALMYFDIDRFKQINDQYGHGVGDAVIREFAARVRSMVRGMDSLARLGGDEFVLLVEGLGNRESAHDLADKLVRAMAAPVETGEHSLHVSTSIGIAYYEAGTTADRLVRAADRAMYEAKRAGRSCWREAATL